MHPPTLIAPGAPDRKPGSGCAGTTVASLNAGSCCVKANAARHIIRVFTTAGSSLLHCLPLVAGKEQLKVKYIMKNTEPQQVS
jgi:hypothetical protein